MPNWSQLRQHLLEHQNARCARCAEQQHLEFSTKEGLAVLGRTDPGDIILLCYGCRRRHETRTHPKRATGRVKS